LDLKFKMWWHQKLGRIAYEDSGIYINLPRKWVAHELSGRYVCSKGHAKQNGLLFFLVDSYLTPGVKPLEDIAETNKISIDELGVKTEVEITRDGQFNYHMIPSNESNKTTDVWQTDTQTHKITFKYYASAEARMREMEDVRKIINTLVK